MSERIEILVVSNPHWNLKFMSQHHNSLSDSGFCLISLLFKIILRSINRSCDEAYPYRTNIAAISIVLDIALSLSHINIYDAKNTKREIHYVFLSKHPVPQTHLNISEVLIDFLKVNLRYTIKFFKRKQYKRNWVQQITADVHGWQSLTISLLLRFHFNGINSYYLRFLAKK